MSRNQPTSSLSKYKISSPQPFVPSQSSPSVNDGSAYHPFPPSQPAYAPVLNQGQASPAVVQNGSKPGGSPARPARSRMRDQPGPPSSQPSRRNLEAIQTQTAARPSNGSFAGGHDLPVSPITPVSPNGSSTPQPGEALFTDPFAADRSQRSELRAQTSEAAQREAQPFRDGAGGPTTDKLRNVVGAFMSASKGREEPPMRRPGKSGARQTGKEEFWDIDPTDGGKFGEIDGVLRKIRKDWPFVVESDFSASTLALSLLSQTSPGTLPAHPSLSSFLKLHEALSSSLQSAVQAHFQSFAASLPAHATFLSTLARAQQQVRTSKEALKEAREGFAGKSKSELAGVRLRERVVRDMLRILDVM